MSNTISLPKLLSTKVPCCHLNEEDDEGFQSLKEL